jgi:hypothetical protein
VRRLGQAGGQAVRRLRGVRAALADALGAVEGARLTDPRDIAAMKLASPAPWITEQYLSRQAANPELSEAAALQLATWHTRNALDVPWVEVVVSG